MKITVCSLVKNEERGIEQCLKRIKPVADEIIVLDGASEDRTVEIAKKYADEVVIRKRKGTFGEEKNFIMSKAKYDWILFVDPDEVLNKEFIDGIKKIKESENGKYSAYVFPRKTYFKKLFRPLPFSYPGFLPRLVNRKYCRFIGLIHESLIITGRKKFVPVHIFHYPENVFSKPKSEKRLKEKLDLYKDLLKTEDKERKSYIKSRRKINSIPIVFGDLGFCLKSMIVDLKFYRKPWMLLYMIIWFLHILKKFLLVETKKIQF